MEVRGVAFATCLGLWPVVAMAMSGGDERVTNTLKLEGFPVAADYSSSTRLFTCVAPRVRGEAPDVVWHGRTEQPTVSVVSQFNIDTGEVTHAVLDLGIRITSISVSSDRCVLVAGQSLGQDAIVIKLSPGFNNIDLATVGDDDYDIATGVVSQRDGSFSIVGYTANSEWLERFPGRWDESQSGQPPEGRHGVGFVACFDASGELKASPRGMPALGESDVLHSRQLGDDSLLLVGNIIQHTVDPSGPLVTDGPLGRSDVFAMVIRLSDMRIVRSVIMGGTCEDSVQAIHIDGDRAYILVRCGAETLPGGKSEIPSPESEWDCGGVEMTVIVTVALDSMKVIDKQVIRGDDTIRGESLTHSDGVTYVSLESYARKTAGIKWGDYYGGSGQAIVLRLAGGGASALYNHKIMGHWDHQSYLYSGDGLLIHMLWMRREEGGNVSEIRVTPID